jgi:hypothetical protein
VAGKCNSGSSHFRGKEVHEALSVQQTQLTQVLQAQFNFIVVTKHFEK